MPPTLYAAVKFLIPENDANPQVLQKLEEMVDALNEIFQPYLVSKFLISDQQVQGVLLLQETPRFLQIVQLVDLEMKPASLKYGLGIGNISGLDTESAEWKGSAVTAVNKAVKEASAGEQDVAVRLLSPFLTRTVNTLLAVESDLRNDWSEAHREAIKLVRQGMTQVEMAEILGVTQAAISQRLKHARWERYQEVVESIKELLAQSRWRTLLPWDLRKTRKNKKSSS